MNTRTIVLSFAALVATGLAQSPAAKPTPSQEIAPLVAVEEQEGDLAKAERLYKEAIEGTTLSAAAKQLATVRLIDLLGKLGKVEERKQWIDKLDGGAPMAFDNATEPSPQERERQQALRAKARELVQKAMDQSSPPFPAAVGIYDQELLLQIEWLGEAAVPEIGAVLQREKPHGSNDPALRGINTPRDAAIVGLAGILWHLGSPGARAQLEDAYRDAAEDWRHLLVGHASRFADPLRDLVVLWLRDDPSDKVVLTLLDSQFQKVVQGQVVGFRRVHDDLGPELMLSAIERRSPRVRGMALTRISKPLSPKAAELARGMILDLIGGDDPEAAWMAWRGLTSSLLHRTAVGRELLIDNLARAPHDVVLPMGVSVPEWYRKGDDGRYVVDVARRLWPKLVAASRADLSESVRRWLGAELRACANSLDGAIVDDVIALHGAGFPELLTFLGKLDSAQGLRLAQAFARTDDTQLDRWLMGLRFCELPPEALPFLTARKEAVDDRDTLRRLMDAVSNTGNPDAVAWLQEQAKRPELRSNNPLGDNLLQLGRRTQAEPVRAAMRQYAETVGSEAKSKLYLALLSMHDTETLASLQNSPLMSAAARHPYAKAEDAKPLSPLAYVLMDQPDPPHGFTEAELLEFVRREATLHGNGRIDGLDPTRVPTPIVTMLAEISDMSLQWVEKTGAHTAAQRIASWQMEMANRIAAEADMQGPLHRWLDGAVAAKGRVLRVIESFGERDRVAFRPQLERMLAGDDLELATFAFEQLRREGGFDYESLTNSKHRTIAHDAALLGMARGTTSIAVALRHLATSPEPQEFARYLGDKVAVEAVPALLQLVQHKDPEVRQAANEALAKIRFVHEQKSYWDRITKGLDASPTSAVEKLLLQAKPGAPAEQRLLAITSLGTLGVPEALPFLIEWTQDADPTVAKAAKDAITQIHLQPRR